MNRQRPQPGALELQKGLCWRREVSTLPLPICTQIPRPRHFLSLLQQFGRPLPRPLEMCPGPIRKPFIRSRNATLYISPPCPHSGSAGGQVEGGGEGGLGSGASKHGQLRPFPCCQCRSRMTWGSGAGGWSRHLSQAGYTSSEIPGHPPPPHPMHCVASRLSEHL